MSPIKKRISGHDRFGAFEVMDNWIDNEPEFCITGDHTPRLLVVYLREPIMPPGVDVKDTLLGHPDGAIGIDCGCYARFHGQIAGATAIAEQLPR